MSEWKDKLLNYNIEIYIYFFNLHDVPEAGPCFSNPCFNSGSCTVIGKNYTCNCQKGTDGEHCQGEIN